MRSELLFVCLAVGVGTYLFRYLPTRLGKGAARPRLGGPLGIFLGAFLGSVGIAAVAALLVSSLLGVLDPAAVQGPRPTSWLTAAVGVAATLGAFLWRRDVAVATILGAAAYGLAWWLVGLAF